jgi:hypothetical protein
VVSKLDRLARWVSGLMTILQALAHAGRFGGSCAVRSSRGYIRINLHPVNQRRRMATISRAHSRLITSDESCFSVV